MSDLLQASGYAAIVYLLFSTLISFGSGRPLVEWINPGRRYLPLLGATLLGAAYGSLRYAVNRYHGETHLSLLHKLVSQEQAHSEVVSAVSLAIFAATVFAVAGYCWLMLPRAPNTFKTNPKDLAAEYGRALTHYVRWAGGIDFAMLCEVRQGLLHEVATGFSDEDILRGLKRLPGLHSSDGGQLGPTDVAQQKAIWKEFALGLFTRWPQHSDQLYPLRHGRCVAMGYDLRYGALYAEMVEEEPAPPGGSAVGIFLFAVSMNQHEVHTMNAARHFTLLSQAIRHIRTGVAKG